MISYDIMLWYSLWWIYQEGLPNHDEVLENVMWDDIPWNHPCCHRAGYHVAKVFVALVIYSHHIIWYEYDIIWYKTHHDMVWYHVTYMWYHMMFRWSLSSFFKNSFLCLFLMKIAKFHMYLPGIDPRPFSCTTTLPPTRPRGLVLYARDLNVLKPMGAKTKNQNT